MHRDKAGQLFTVHREGYFFSHNNMHTTPCSKAMGGDQEVRKRESGGRFSYTIREELTEIL